MYGYIYETTNLINGKRYIGRHKSGVFTNDYKGSGKHLGNAIRKYGWDSFSVRLMIPCFTEEELNSEEEFLIDYFDCVNSKEYYNEYPGGHGGFPTGELSPNYGCKQSSETIERRRKNLLGRVHSEDSRKKISDSVKFQYSNLSEAERSELQRKRAEGRVNKPSNFKGHHFSKESKEKMSKSLSGVNHPLYGKFGPDNPSYGQVRSSEQRARISAGKIGKKRVYNSDGKYIYIDASELDAYLSNGYVMHKKKVQVG